MTDDKNEKILTELFKIYPELKCELEFNSNFELLVAVVLSAQCTDKRVNIVTKELFKKFNTPKALSLADVNEIESIIKSCGFYHNKARAIINLSKDIMARFNGEMPTSKEDLKSLAGVGEKTANVVLSTAYLVPAIAVDTHVFRVSNRLGLANASNVKLTQKQLEENIDKSLWSKTHLALVTHGRYVCKALKPDCKNCKLSSLCEKNNLNK